MSNNMSVEEQISRLRDLRENLYDFSLFLQGKMDDVYQHIKNLGKDDMLCERIESYRINYFMPLDSEVRHTIDDLDHHIEYIDRLIDLVRPDIFIDEKGQLY